MCVFGSQYLPVTGIFRARVVHTNNNEHVLEVRADILWSERQCSRLLKDNGDDVVPYVSLSQELREERGGDIGRYMLNCTKLSLSHLH